MANIIKVSSSTAPSVSDPYGDAQLQQQYADLITAKSMQPRNFGTASNAQSIQMGLTQLAQALLGKSLRGDASAAGDQADTVQRQSNAALLEALAPAINQGRQVPLNTQLDSLGPNDPTTSMTTNAAIPDTINPQHQAIASALAGAGVDPKVSGQFLAQALLNKATAPPPAPIKVGAGESLVSPNTFTPLYTASAKDATAHFERKTRLLDNQMAQDYNFDPATGEETLVGKPYKQKAPPASLVMLNDPNVQAGMDQRAKLIANYEAPPPSGFGANNPATYALWKKVTDFNPGYDTKEFDSRQAGVKRWAGINADRVETVNTVTQHLGVLKDAIPALENGDVRATNSIGNYFGVQMGKDPVTNYNVARDIVAREIAKMTAAGVITQEEKVGLQNDLPANGSPIQLNGAIDKLSKLAGGRIHSMRTNFKAVTGYGDENFDRRLTPASIDFEKQYGTAGMPTDTPQTSAPSSGWGQAVVVKP